jgi:Gas vesicle synthesis protein GvpO
VTARAERESTQLREVPDDDDAERDQRDEQDQRNEPERDDAEARDRRDESEGEDRRDKRDEGEDEEDREERSERPGPRKRLPGLQVFERCKEQLSVVTGREADTVSGFSPSEDGWEVIVEVVDIEKIPPTTSVMATYEVIVDDEGNLLEYHLASRYTRGQTKDEG